MSRFVSISIFIIQALFAFLVNMALFLVYAAWTYEGGIDGFTGMVFFQIIYAVIFGLVTLLVCGIMGLPIRLSKRLYTWWTAHSWVSLLIMLAGLVLFFMSLTHTYMKQVWLEDSRQWKSIPNPGLSMMGWALTGFGALHVFPPVKLMDWINRVVNNLLNKLTDHNNRHNG